MTMVQEDQLSVKIGNKYGKLTVLGPCFSLPTSRCIKLHCVCECLCGEFCVCQVNGLKTRHIVSCGICKIISFDPRVTHGLSRHPLYSRWRIMIRRCHNENNDNYKYYGGRGIRVCDEWRNSLEQFYKWGIDNGWKDGLELDRIDTNGNYEPSNCRWVTKKINGNNTRTNRFITAFGETKTMMQWSEDNRCKVSYDTFKVRIKLGWNAELAITQISRCSPRRKATSIIK